MSKGIAFGFVVGRDEADMAGPSEHGPSLAVMRGHQYRSFSEQDGIARGERGTALVRLAGKPDRFPSSFRARSVPATEQPLGPFDGKKQLVHGQGVADEREGASDAELIRDPSCSASDLMPSGSL